MIPISDDNTRTIQPVIVSILIGLFCAVFAFEFWLDSKALLDTAIVNFGLIPANITGPDHTLFTYMFLHGGWGHIIPNLLFLWIFGDNVEDAMGHAKFLSFFIISGMIAGLAHVLLSGPESTLPLIGASAAISAVLGAYFILFPDVRIRLLFPTIVLAPPLLLFGAPLLWRFYVPSTLFIGLWFSIDLFQAIFGDEGSDVAFWTHIIGFACGVITAITIKQSEWKKINYFNLLKDKLRPKRKDHKKLIKRDFSNR
jgi:membrane associated rhomboid family serine protease